MSIKLGLHMCGWGDRPVPDVLVAARELGYDGVEQDASPDPYATSKASLHHMNPYFPERLCNLV